MFFSYVIGHKVRQRLLSDFSVLPALHVSFRDAHTSSGDDMNNPIWGGDVALPSFPKAETDLHTDVLIIGGGMAGLLCARMLQKAGADYILLESGRIMSGISGKTTAKITSQHGFLYRKLLRQFGPEKARLYHRAQEDALTQYRLFAKEIDCVFETRANLVYSIEDADLLDQEWDALRQLHIPAIRHDSLPLPFSVTGAISFPNQAQFHPLKFAASIAKDLHIFEHTPVKAFHGNTVITDLGKVSAGKIIVTTHFPINNKHGLYFLKQYQERSYVLALENAAQYQGMYVDGAEKGLSFRNYGDLLLLGGGSHRTGKKGGAWAALEDFAKQYYPNAKEVCRWAAQDCMTLDGIPYIGQYSASTPDLYVATGFNKWGMTSSMVSATLLADLILGRDNPYVELFSPSRSMLRPQLAVNAAESAWNLLTPTAPRCPHLGCALKWKPAERSWDCPCHGSRFAEDGKLLDDPATGDLE